jgi:acetolactate synthase-1/2/3 large subunit
MILDTFKRHGIRNIFGLPSAQIALIMHEASTDNYFNYVTTHHEEAAAHMAHALHCVSGEVAVCFGTVGPGATNLLPGVAAAKADNIPLIVLTSNNQVNALDPYNDLLQSADHIALYKPITKWRAQIRDANRAPELVERAIQMAKSGRPGVVHLDIPCDVGTFQCDDESEKNVSNVPKPVPSSSEIEEICQLLASAKRPLLIAGGGVARSGGTKEFRRLVEVTHFPATTTPKGKGVLAPDTPAHIGSGGIIAGDPLFHACRDADVILSIGCKFSTWMPVNKAPLYSLPEGQKIIQIDIDPETLGKGLPIYFGAVGDAALTAGLLADKLASMPLSAEPGWLETLMRERREYQEKLDKIAAEVFAPGTSFLNSAAVCKAIVGMLPEDAIICIDGGQTMQWALSYFYPTRPDRIVYNPGMGHLGSGLPFALAAKSYDRSKTVVLVTGDGAFGCTAQELETAARYGLNVVAVVLNDSFWGMYTPFQDMLHNDKLGIKLTDVNFANVAKGYGCEGFNISTLDELKSAFKDALNAKKPRILDVRVGFTPHPQDDYWGQIVLAGMKFPEM